MPLPIVNKQGQEFESVEAFNNVLIEGRDAQYLLTPHMFHGGVHLSDESVPWGRDRAPVRCIADGEVVAYRMMKQYLTSEYQGERLRYSNSFCLVRHHYQETSPEGEKREFRYYSLYMHLCPLDEYPQETRYRLKKSWRVRHSVPSAEFQPPALALKVGEEFELVDGVARQRGLVAGQGEFEFARIKMLTAGGSSGEVLAIEGMDNLWLAMDESAIEPAFTVTQPSWIYDQVEAVVTENMVGRADPPGRKGSTGYPLAGGDSCSVAKGSLIQFSAHAIQLQEIGGKARQMVRCRVVPMATIVWLCVEAQNIEIKRQGTSSLDKLYVLPRPVAIKGGDVIGYLGRYEGPETRFGGRNEEHLVHLEVFSDDPNVEAIVGSGRWQEEGYKLVKGESHGALVGPATDFFGALYRACDLDKDGELSAEEIWAGLKEKRTADGLFKIVAEHNSEWWAPASQAMLDQFAAVEKEPEEALLRAHEQERVQNLSWMDKPEMQQLGFSGPKVWFFYPMALTNKPFKRCFCYEQGVVSSPCSDGFLDVTKKHFELLADELGVEKEVLRAIAVAETGDKPPFVEFVKGEIHSKILFERHHMKKHLQSSGFSDQKISQIQQEQPEIVHGYVVGYAYGTLMQQYNRFIRAKAIDSDSAIKSCSWGKFQVMGASYHHLYSSPSELVEAQNYCALQHLNYYKMFLVKEKHLLPDMRSKNWLSIAIKYNGKNQVGYDAAIERAYKKLKVEW